MRFDIITIFPDFFDGPLDYGIVRRARQSNLVQICVQDLREFAHDRHHTVDDRPFGGGEGMVLKPEPVFEAVEGLLERKPGDAENHEPMNHAIVLLSAAGTLFQQEAARRLAQLDRIVLICGRYEGVDERVAEHLATDEISIGDYVLTGGELPAALIVDAVTRLLPGALGNEQSVVHESFSEPPDPALDKTAHGKPDATLVTGLRKKLTIRSGQKQFESLDISRGLLDYPHYTRPPNYRGWPVPEVLLSGNHEEIRRWRRKKALEKTLRNRPDLLASTSAAGAKDVHDTDF